MRTIVSHIRAMDYLCFVTCRSHPCIARGSYAQSARDTPILNAMRYTWVVRAWLEPTRDPWRLRPIGALQNLTAVNMVTTVLYKKDD